MTPVNHSDIVIMVNGKEINPGGPTNGYYTLSSVIQKIDDGQFLIRSNATRFAFQDFGWGISDIKGAYKKLQPKHFYKTASSVAKPGTMIDYYKGSINGEEIYTHFYIDNATDMLIINSFKRL